MQKQVLRIGAFGLLPIVMAMLVAVAPHARGDDGWGAVDGAIWRFSLTPQFRKQAEPLRGIYRVQNLEIFQAESYDSRENMNKKVGSSSPFGKGKRPTHTIVEVKELRAWDKSRKMVLIEGKAHLRRDEAGEIVGVLATKDGTRYDMKVVRFRE